MRRALAGLLAVAWCGCGQDPLPEARLVSVVPKTVATTDAEHLELQLEALLPFTLDYSNRAGQPRPELEAWVGPQQLASVSYVGEGLFTAQLQPGLPVGMHDVRVRLSDGREAVLPQALRSIEAFDLSSYRMDVHGAHFYAGQPFPVTLYAVGGEAYRFEGTVRLSSNVGPVTPERSKPFVTGVRTQDITVNGSGDAVIIYLEDSSGRRGQSDPFLVMPAAP